MAAEHAVCHAVIRHDSRDYGTATHSEGGFHRLGNSGPDPLFEHKAIHHDFDVVRLVAIHLHARRDLEQFAINPNAPEAEGDTTYPDLKSVPGGVEAVVIGTKPERAEATIHECAELGIKHVWMHRGFGGGSVCADATVVGRENGIQVIDGGCPLMFGPTADVGHKIMKVMLGFTKNVPKEV